MGFESKREKSFFRIGDHVDVSPQRHFDITDSWHNDQREYTGVVIGISKDKYDGQMNCGARWDCLVKCHERNYKFTYPETHLVPALNPPVD